MSNQHADSNRRYINLHVTGAAQLRRFREVPVRRGNFLAVELHGADPAQPIDCIVRGSAALSAMEHIGPLVEKGHDVRVGFRAGDLFVHQFESHNQQEDRTVTRHLMKARLFDLSWVCVDGEPRSFRGAGDMEPNEDPVRVHALAYLNRFSERAGRYYADLTALHGEVTDGQEPERVPMAWRADRWTRLCNMLRSGLEARSTVVVGFEGLAPRLSDDTHPRVCVDLDRVVYAKMGGDVVYRRESDSDSQAQAA